MISRLREKGAGDLLKCIQCGSCTSSCIVNTVYESFNPRRIIGSIVRFNKLPEQDPWLCSSCSKCVERCPQRVNPMSIIMALRMINYEDGNAFPSRVVEFVEQIKKSGLIFPLSKESNEKRRLLGLSELKIDEEGLNEVRKILSEAGF
ncbi:MAG: 4Fe-4S dicluster domain-containing protein [Crenarchaeota archaeon]|nr:4Fe-4S dicluster domain-containing protein [Thermoproteota archaeon]MDW8033863.1 4Fe-4S dicluster domain-containing protein [Nitrososphaerota archaeon]